MSKAPARKRRASSPKQETGEGVPLKTQSRPVGFTVSVEKRLVVESLAPSSIDAPPIRGLVTAVAPGEAGIGITMHLEMAELPPELLRDLTLQLIEGNRANIEADAITLLEAVNMVLGNGATAPQWLAEAFGRCIERLERYEARTLDEAFGHKPEDPRTVAAKARNHKIMAQVHAALVAAIQANPAEPIMPDGHPFATVGDSITPRLGKTKVYNLYREAVDRHGMQDIVQLRRLLLASRRDKSSDDHSR